MRVFLSVVAALLLSLVVWLVFGLRDLRRGDGVCQIHQTRMETQGIHPPAGLSPSHAPGYYEAREQRFPNVPERMARKTSWRVDLVYVCPECERAREAWRP
jgi:hypothetical protein